MTRLVIAPGREQAAVRSGRPGHGAQPGDVRAQAAGGGAEGTSAAPDHELAPGDVAAEPELPQVPAAAVLVMDEKACWSVRWRVANAGRSQIDEGLIHAGQAGERHEAWQPVAVEMRERDPVVPRCGVDDGVSGHAEGCRPRSAPPRESRPRRSAASRPRSAARPAW